MSDIFGMNIVDIVVTALIVLLSLKGLISGFTKEFFNAVGLIGGLFAATYFNTTLAHYIYNNITDAVAVNVLKVFATAAIFIVVWLLAASIGKAIARVGGDEYLSATSRLGGMLVKFITLFFIFALIAFALSTKPQVAQKFKDTLEKSKLYPVLKSTGATILNMSPATAEKSNSKAVETNTAKAVEQNATAKESNTTKALEENSTAKMDRNRSN